MMKFFSLVLALLMMVFGMFAFDSCEEKPSDDKNVEDNKEDNKEEKKDDAELILGTWEAEIDYTEAMNSDSGLDEEMADYIKVEDFKFTVRATMNKDGTYKFVVTEESAKKALDNFKKAMVSGYKDYFADMAAEYDMTVEDFLAEMEVSSVEEFVDLFFGEEMMEVFTAEFNSEGIYKIENGKFYTSYDGEDEIDESEYETYELSENEFKLIEYVGGNEEDSEFNEYIYPIIFKRVK
ncbi:MAG: hypothetical protein IIU77_07085 [Clostridia bacterium]|nr:hypothetical protein [Clostridia bacterium]